MGRELHDALTTPGVKFGELAAELPGLTRRRGDVTRCRRSRRPGRSASQQQDAVEALEFRVSGLAGLADGFRRLARRRRRTGNALAACPAGERLTPSDVIWADLFQAPRGPRSCTARGSAASPPRLGFVAEPDYASSRYWEEILSGSRAPRRRSGGLHGTGLVVDAGAPVGQELSQTPRTPSWPRRISVSP